MFGKYETFYKKEPVRNTTHEVTDKLLLPPGWVYPFPGKSGRG
jgi:hypothetical protein